MCASGDIVELREEERLTLPELGSDPTMACKDADERLDLLRCMKEGRWIFMALGGLRDLFYLYILLSPSSAIRSKQRTVRGNFPALEQRKTVISKRMEILGEKKVSKDKNKVCYVFLFKTQKFFPCIQMQVEESPRGTPAERAKIFQQKMEKRFICMKITSRRKNENFPAKRNGCINHQRWFPEADDRMKEEAQGLFAEKVYENEMKTKIKERYRESH